MAASLAEFANLMHNFARMGNIAHSPHSNTKLAPEAGKLKPWAAEELHSLLLVAPHKPRVAHSKHQHKGNHSQDRNIRLASLDPIHPHNLARMLLGANHRHGHHRNRPQRRPPTQHYLPELVVAQELIIPLP
jgi:hypothetical protein